MPGDYDVAEYASPWAGAHYLPSVGLLLPLYCTCSWLMRFDFQLICVQFDF